MIELQQLTKRYGDTLAVDALGIYTFDADRRAGQLRPLRAA
jgi:hypothetical protein